jgi:hypothetical protein
MVFMHQGRKYGTGLTAEIFVDPQTPELKQFFIIHSGLGRYAAFCGFLRLALTKPLLHWL